MKKEDIVIKSKGEVLWSNVVVSIKKGIEASENEVKINQAFLKTAEEELKKVTKNSMV